MKIQYPEIKLKNYQPLGGVAETYWGKAWFYNLDALISEFEDHKLPDFSYN